MKNIKTISSDELLKRQLKNKKFKSLYQESEEEFELAREIIKLRKEENMTQSELAKKAGTSQPTIARLESGRYKKVSLPSLKRIGKVLHAVPRIHFVKKKTL